MRGLVALEKLNILGPLAARENLPPILLLNETRALLLALFAVLVLVVGKVVAKYTIAILELSSALKLLF